MLYNSFNSLSVRGLYTGDRIFQNGWSDLALDEITKKHKINAHVRAIVRFAAFSIIAGERLRCKEKRKMRDRK